MLKSILVPLDGSALAERALTYATALSIPTAARLILVHATQAHTVPGTDAREAQSEAVAEAEAYLADVSQRMAARGYTCDLASPYGSAAEWIVEEAKLRHADIIVMTSHGRTGPGRWLLGSVAEWVVAHSPVPVLVERAFHPTRREPLLADHPRILVPLDGSLFAESVIHAAGELAEDLGADLVLLRVEPHPTHLLKDADGRVVAYIDELEQSARIAARDYLAGVSERLRDSSPELSVATDVVFGEAGDAIAQAAIDDQAALIMMATHGRTGLLRTALGSVAGRVLEQSTTPLVLVHPVAVGAPA